MPSAEFRWNERLSRQEIRAIRNINIGEEITLCYFTIEIMEMSKEDRQAYMEDHYGFKCGCEVCSLEGIHLHIFMIEWQLKLKMLENGHVYLLKL